MQLIYIVLFILFTGLSLNTQAREVQKWIDKDGQIHYGDFAESDDTTTLKVPANPPPSASSSTSASSAAERLEKQQKYLNAKQEEREQKNETKAKAKQQQVVANTNCNNAKGRYNLMKNGGRLVTYDANGERHYLSDEERNKNMNDARQAMSKWCK